MLTSQILSFLSFYLALFLEKYLAMHIIIIGAGLGGLAASFCFARAGHKVTLLERRSEISPTRGSVAIQAGATRALIAWGLQKDFEAVSDNIGGTVFHDLYTGAIINRTLAVELSDCPAWGSERGEIQRILHQSARKAGVDIRVGCQVDDIRDDDDGARVILEDRSQLRADLVIVADGIASRLRSKVLSKVPESSLQPIVSDSTIYNIKLSLEEARQDPDLAQLCKDTRLNMAFGKNTFVVFRINEKLQTFGAGFAITEPTDSDRLFDQVSGRKCRRSLFVC